MRALQKGDQVQLLRSLGRGQYFGEAALSGESIKRSASVVARTSVTLLALDGAK